MRFLESPSPEDSLRKPGKLCAGAAEELARDLHRTRAQRLDQRARPGHDAPRWNRGAGAELRNVDDGGGYSRIHEGTEEAQTPIQLVIDLWIVVPSASVSTSPRDGHRGRDRAIADSPRFRWLGTEPDMHIDHPTVRTDGPLPPARRPKPTVNRYREKETKRSAGGPGRPASVEILLRELDDLLERIAAESTECAEAQHDPLLPSLAMRAARWLVSRRVVDRESGPNTASPSPKKTTARIEDAWSQAAIETQARGHVLPLPSDRMEGRSTSALDVLAEELATYRAHLPELLREHRGDFMLDKGTEIIGFFPDDSAAIREGYRRFGGAPFLVKEVAFPERVVDLPNVVL